MKKTNSSIYLTNQTMKLFLYFGLLLAVFASCEKQNNDEFPKLVSPPLHEKISDTLAIYDFEVPELFEIYYVGEKKDTIDLDYNMRRFFAPPPPLPPPPRPGETYSKEKIYQDSLRAAKSLNKWKELRNNNLIKKYFMPYENVIYGDEVKDSLKISIDTSQTLYERLHWYSRLEEDMRFPAYPVMIENISSKPVVVGVENYILLTKESLNEKGEWVHVNDQALFGCGNGIRDFILPPNEIIITSTLLFKDFGNTRIRIGESISNEY